MSNERSSFGLNSILPAGYMSKAEAFAKCLQDKLRSLGGGDEPSTSQLFTPEEIADHVYLQGPMAYQRIPENGVNGVTKYMGSMVDRRGTSSDSEDEEEGQKLISANSVDSWCSCDEGPDPEDDEEVIDALAAQIKGSPPIHNPRMRNYKKKSREERIKVSPPPSQDADLFFDFDLECFSPVEERLMEDAGATTPPPSPVNVEPEKPTKDSGICSCEETASRADDEVANDLEKTDEEPKPAVTVLCEGVEIDESYLPSPRMKLRRCSSLKTWKTPPGTPGRKKIVRFADALGLDLADVRMFLDEIPKIPNSAFDDLHYELPPHVPEPVERTLIALFQQPGTQMDFIQRVRQNNVSLESALLTEVALLAISGIVRVRNLSFHKFVHVRYSKDNWASFSDLQATFVPNSSDGFCDNFSFTLYGHTLNIGERLEFAIRYDCSAGQFWDNNGGTNYAFQCMPRTTSQPLFPPLGSSPLEAWNKFY